MSAFTFTIALGLERQYATLPATDRLEVWLLKAAGLEADNVLKAYDNMAAIIAASNDVADFTNYAPKLITTPLVPVIDDSSGEVRVSIGNQTWTSAGGATDNQLGMIVVCYEPNTAAPSNANKVPITAHAWDVTTNGANITAEEPADGFLLLQ